MKTISKNGVILFLILLIYSCASNDPGKTLKEYYSYLILQKFDRAIELLYLEDEQLDPHLKDYLNTILSAGSSELREKGYKGIKIIEQVTSAENSEVIIKYSFFPNEATQNIEFVKMLNTANGWKIEFDNIDETDFFEFKKKNETAKFPELLKENEQSIKSTKEKISKSKNGNINSKGNDSGIELIPNSIVAGKYAGKIGDKPFELALNHEGEEHFSGYNITGTNKRPVHGKITKKYQENRLAIDGNPEYKINYLVVELELFEPGNDKWDGVFDLEILISDLSRSGTGTWMSNNGKLKRDISFEFVYE